MKALSGRCACGGDGGGGGCGSGGGGGAAGARTDGCRLKKRADREKQVYLPIPATALMRGRVMQTAKTKIAASLYPSPLSVILK